MDLESSREFCVTGISAVKRISVKMVRASYFSRRRDGCYDILHTVWNREI